MSANHQSTIETNHTNNKHRRLGLEILALVAVILAIWLPRLFRLNAFVTPDEHLWLTRSANFYYALANGDLASTYQTEHPGVTVMLAGATGFLARFPEYRDSGLEVADEEELNVYLINAKGVTPLSLLLAGRLILVLGNLLALALAYLYMRRLLGLLPAFIGFLLIAFDPFHLALSRVLHLDGTLSGLLLLSLLAFTSYLRERRALDLILSGAVAGLAWLTKSPGLFLVPVVGLLALFQMWRETLSRESPTFIKHIWNYFWPLISWGVIGLIVFVAFWPAMWVDPVGTITSILSKAQEYAGGGHAAGVYFYGSVTRRVDIAYFYPVTYLWHTTPVVLLGLLGAAWGFFTKRKPFYQPGTSLTLLGLLLFGVIFTLAITPGLKKLDRYLLPVYAPLNLIAGMGWAGLVYWVTERKNSLVYQYGAYLLLVLVIGAQMALSLSTYPYYFSYYNPAMGGSKKAPQAMMVGWGEGLDQAAEYLNQKPNAKNLRVISWYGYESFSHFFRGRTRSMEFSPDVSESKWDKFLSSDYAVVYVNQWQRNLQKQILDYLSDLEPEKTIWIDGIEYVRIYKLP